MSLHYLVNISIEFTKSVSCQDIEALDFLINGEMRPGTFPQHACFADAKNVWSLFTAHADGGFAPGEYTCVYWRKKGLPGRSGVNLVLPSVKDIQGWWETLRLVDWFCSMAKEDGLIGYTTQEDNRISTTLLYSVNGKLHFRDENTFNGVTCFTTGTVLHS